jgi:ethanolamine ammonia-lyase large subunit
MEAEWIVFTVMIIMIMKTMTMIIIIINAMTTTVIVKIKTTIGYNGTTAMQTTDAPSNTSM